MDGSAEGIQPTPDDIAGKAPTGAQEAATPPNIESAPVIPLTPRAEGDAETQQPDGDDVSAQILPLIPRTETAEQQEAADPERSKGIAEGLIASRVRSIEKALQEDPNKKATPEENAAILADYYPKDGFADATYAKFNNKIPVGEKGIELTTDAGKITVQTITGQTDKDGKITYTCDAVREGETESFTTEVSGSELAAAHMEQNADAIAQNFTTPEEQALVKWHAEGNDGDVPVTGEQLTTIEEAMKPKYIEKADAAIATQREYLAGKIEGLTKQIEDMRKDPAKEKEVAKLEEERAEIGRLAAYLQTTTEINGDLLRAHIRASGLDAASRFAEKQGDQLLAKSAKNALAELAPELKNEQERLLTYLSENGVTISEKTQQELLALLDKDPSNFLAILNNADIQNLPDMMSRFFGKDAEGKDIDVAQAQKILESFISNNPFLTPEQRKWFKDNKGKIGKGFLYVLIAALAAGAVAIAIPTVAAIGTVGAAQAMTGGRR